MAKKAPIPKWTSSEITDALARHIGVRTNVIVPNVSWGFFRHHEADVLVIKSSNWADEIEIKVSAADIKRDLGKNHGKGHVRPNTVKALWFAVPAELADDPNIPEVAGIYSLSRHPKFGIEVKVKRAPQLNKRARKLTDAEVNKILRLGYLRMWTSRQHRVADLNGRRWLQDNSSAFVNLCNRFQGQSNGKWLQPS